MQLLALEQESCSQTTQLALRLQLASHVPYRYSTYLVVYVPVIYCIVPVIGSADIECQVLKMKVLNVIHLLR